MVEVCFSINRGGWLFVGNSSKNSHELTRMTRIVGWVSVMAVGAVGVVFGEDRPQISRILLAGRDAGGPFGNESCVLSLMGRVVIGYNWGE
jgi:hypothetical protein